MRRKNRCQTFLLCYLPGLKAILSEIRQPANIPIASIQQPLTSALGPISGRVRRPSFFLRNSEMWLPVALWISLELMNQDFLFWGKAAFFSE